MQSKLSINIKCYNIIFIFENNLREFIKLELEKRYGENWFNKLNGEIQKEAKSNKDKLIKYLSPNKINENILSFLFLSHLRRIIRENWPDPFFNFFKNANKDVEKCKDKISDKLFEIEVIRNLLSHAHLLDEPLLTQLKANINFFRNYIPSYNDKLFLDDTILIEVELKAVYSEVIHLIEQMKNVPQKMLNHIKRIDLELAKQIEIYNKFPKTRDKRKKINDFLKETGLIKKLSY